MRNEESMASQSKIGRYFLAFATVLVVLALGGYAYFSQSNYQNSMNIAKEWARLEDFPVSEKILSLESKGSMLSREFTVTFKAPLEDIDNWLKQSPGTADVTPKTNGSVRAYQIEPGRGAQHAELEVDDESGTVTINVYWS